MATIKTSELAEFIGTFGYHQGWAGVVWTDGVFYLSNNGLSWLCTDISSYWVEEKIRKIPFQVWTLKVNKDKSAVLTMQEDSDKPAIVTQKYNVVDCPLEELKLFLIDDGANVVLLLPSEY